MSSIQICNKAITPGSVKVTSDYEYYYMAAPSQYLNYDFFSQLIGQEGCIVHPDISGTRGDYIKDWYAYPAYDYQSSNDPEVEPDRYWFVFGKIPGSSEGTQWTTVGNRDMMEVHLCQLGTDNIYQTALNNLNTYPLSITISFNNLMLVRGYKGGVGVYLLDDQIYPTHTGHSLTWSYNVDTILHPNHSVPRSFWTAWTDEGYKKNDKIKNYNTASFDWGADPFYDRFYGSTAGYQVGPDFSKMQPPTGVPEAEGLDPSGTASGGGTFSAWGDNIDYADPPSNSAITSNLLTMFKLTNEELNGIAHFLYTADFLTNFKKLFTNPFDYLVSLQMLPINTSSTITANVCIGGLDTEVTGERLLTQYWQSQELYLDVNEYYGSFADYSPDTRIHLYVPFCGFREVRVEDVMAGGIGIKFNVDMLTGDVVAQVKMYGAYTQSIMYTLAGNCSAQAPLTGRDYSNIYRTALSQTVSGINHGNPVGGLVGGAMTIALSKPSVQRGGAISGNAGQLSQFTPYLLFTRPAISQPGDYAHYKGRPSNITRRLRDLSGYTEVDTLITEGFSNASAAEMEMIRAALKGGVYL